MVNTTVLIGPKYFGHLFYDVVKTAAVRMTQGMAEDLRPHNVAVIALSPGWSRTERVLGDFQVDTKTWQSIPILANSETPEFTGRAVAALAADPDLMKRSGQCFEVAQIARDFGFTDIDGRQPVPYSEQLDEG